MANMDQHPTVQAVRKKQKHQAGSQIPPKLDAAWLRKLCLEMGADDVGFISMTRSEVADQKEFISAAFPQTQTLISLVCRFNQEPLRSPARSVANLEFHQTTDHTDETTRRIVSRLQSEGIRAMNPSAGFPMEMNQFPGRTWVVSHKPVAEAAGLGRMGIHRNVIHPKFGNFINLATILLAAEVTEESQPLDYNPCLECKLCVSVCPVGAIGSDGHFDALACLNHNYREFMGGFTDWATQVADSKDGNDYRRRVTDSESASLWQSLSFGANYKSAYCMAVCPAGEDVIGPFLSSRANFVKEVVKPFQEKIEPVYVVPGTDAEAHVQKRFPHKKVRSINSGLRAGSIAAFLFNLPLIFQRGQSKGLNAVYHFTFTGEEKKQATIIIRDQKIQVLEGHIGKPDLRATADSRAWLKFLSKESGLLPILLFRKLRIKGNPRLLQAFGRCFPT